MSVVLTAAPAIPGLRFRPYAGPQDHPEMHRVHQAVAAANGIEEVISLEQFDLSYANHVNCDHDRDILLAEVDGNLVAYSRVFWSELLEGGRSYENFGFVHPEWRRRGIGTAMHRHNEARLREIAGGHAGVGPKWLSSEAVDGDPGAAALLRADGYEPVRWFFEMVAPSLEDVPSVGVPDGVEVRPVTREQYRRIWDAMDEAFRDHWGATPGTEEEWRTFEGDPDNADPRYWRVAWDGDEVAGVVVTVPQTEANARHQRRRVYVASVSVRRPWRRRGLARALLAGSLIGAREDGFTSASLGVDAENPTGALALYESLGFERHRSEAAYRKPLEG